MEFKKRNGDATRPRAAHFNARQGPLNVHTLVGGRLLLPFWTRRGNNHQSNALRKEASECPRSDQPSRVRVHRWGVVFRVASHAAQLLCTEITGEGPGA